MFSITLVCIFVLWLFCRKEEKESKERLEKERKESEERWEQAEKAHKKFMEHYEKECKEFNEHQKQAEKERLELNECIKREVKKFVKEHNERPEEFAKEFNKWYEKERKEFKECWRDWEQIEEEVEKRDEVIGQDLAQIKGKVGEHLVKSILNTLGDEYLVLNDLLIRTSSNKTSQIDHMIISPYGIFVIETKYYRGLICGNKEEEQWSQYLNHGSQKYNFFNPIMQNESHIKVVKNMIINSYGNDLNLPIVSIVTFSKIATLSDYILDNNLAIYYSEIPNFIFNFGKEKKIDINTVKDIYNYFSRLNIVDPVERETHAKLVRSIKGLS